MKIFISHKNYDSVIATKIANELDRLRISYYLDVLDPSVTKNGKELTDHIKKNLNSCTDIIVVMSEITKTSQWVPFEIGMAAQIDMPTATYLQNNVELPEYLQYWPRLKYPSDIQKYVSVRKRVQENFRGQYLFEKADIVRNTETARFYDELKRSLCY